MNIVWLIGNGFDLKLGLSTRYVDFYRWYMRQSPPADKAINDFRNKIDPDSKDWSDLELALGKYLADVKTEDDAIAIFNDVLSNLQRYIAEAQRCSITDQSDDSSFIGHLFNPTQTFLPKSKNKIRTYANFFDNNINVRIILFNYTTTLERLIGWQGTAKKFKLNASFIREINAIEHVHGYCDSAASEVTRMALGLDNAEQIANPELRESLRVLNRYIKPRYNDTFEVMHHDNCLAWINNATVFCVYGMSMGATDQTWWQAIGLQMKDQKFALLFVHLYRDIACIGNSGPDYQEQIDKDRDFVLQAIGQENSPGLKARIFVTYSPEIFQLAPDSRPQFPPF